MARSQPGRGNLPAETTSFIGRRVELGELRRLLGSARVVSLVGPGGVGKTRLAIRIGRDVARAFSGGAWLIDLAELQDTGLIANVAMAALDLRDQTGTDPLKLVLSYLRDQEALLVVDNCEHLLAAAAELVTAVTRAAPGVRILATSREPLSVSGEFVVPVPPLQLPTGSPGDSLSQLRQNEAVMLFSERAAAASGRFELTEANRSAVVDLCRRVDGLPLAIELAAVRVRHLSPRQILDRLSDRFDLLTGGSRAALPRHQTLRTTIEWSHALLGSDEQTLLRRLSVFAGRFTLDDAEALVSAEDAHQTQPLDLLSSLVDKSLVVREETGQTACYRLHETMRDYGRLKLREAHEEEVVESRVARYYRLACLRAAPDARYNLLDWLHWMDLEIDTIRSVLRSTVRRGEYDVATDLLSAMGWFWITRATTEGGDWLDEVLPNSDRSSPTYGLAHFVRGFLAVLQNNPEVAMPALHRAVTAARETADLALLAQSLSMSSIAENLAGNGPLAEVLLDDARGVSAPVDDLPAKVALLQAEALNGFFRGDIDAVKAASQDGVRCSRDAGDLYSLGMMLLNRGLVALVTQDLDLSRACFIEGLQTAHRIDDRVAQFYLLDALGCHAAKSRQPRLAAKLFGAAETIRTQAGAKSNAILLPLLAEALALVKTSLGTELFKSQFELGGRLGRDRAVNVALGMSPADPSTGELLGFEPLPKRQAQVAALVADGLSNKQIGTRLFISERTVETHVRTILNRLGFSTRAQIANWIGVTNPAR